MRENGRVFLFAALVPPREILDELWSAMQVVPDRPPPADPGPAGRHKARRWHKQTVTVAVAPPAPALDAAPVAHVNVTLAKFGNLALDDTRRVQAAMGRAAAEWSSPRLRLTGRSTLEPGEDSSIWVDLDGDLDALSEVARGVHKAAKGLSLFVDRRLFQPRVRVGSLRPDATEAEVEALLTTLATFETNAWWQTEFGLYTRVDQGLDLPSFKTVAEIPLGPHVVH